jgi:CRISPR-associated protein Csx16
MGRRYVVSRHAGAVEWLRRRGVEADEVVGHLEVGRLEEGDVVIGTLPLHLAAEVCRRGCRYIHLALDAPAGARGRELTAEEMERYGARLEEYEVKGVD